jgi:hypothetical protein
MQNKEFTRHKIAIMKWALHVVILCSVLPFANAIPNGVVGCGAGREALGFNDNVHATLMQVGGGPLSDFNLTMTLNDQVLDPNVPIDFEIQKDHNLTLTAGGDQFAGFLVRMESPDGVRTVDSILPIETFDPITNATSTGGAKEAYICKQAYFVAGVCHDSQAKKSTVEFNLNMESVTENLVLDVSVVIKTSIGENISHWYFTSYKLNAVSDAMDTTSPTPSPTIASSEVPTASDISGTTKRRAFEWLMNFSTLMLAGGTCWF